MQSSCHCPLGFSSSQTEALDPVNDSLFFLPRHLATIIFKYCLGHRCTTSKIISFIEVCWWWAFLFFLVLDLKMSLSSFLHTFSFSVGLEVCSACLLSISSEITIILGSDLPPPQQMRPLSLLCPVANMGYFPQSNTRWAARLWTWAAGLSINVSDHQAKSWFWNIWTHSSSKCMKLEYKRKLWPGLAFYNLGWVSYVCDTEKSMMGRADHFFPTWRIK